MKYSAPNIFLSDNAQFVEFAVKFNQEALKGENYDWAVVQTGPWNSAISGDLFRNIRIFLIPKKANLVVKNGFIQSDQSMLFVDVFINPNAGCRLQYWSGSGESIAYERLVLEVLIKDKPFNLEFKVSDKDKAILYLADVVD